MSRKPLLYVAGVLVVVAAGIGILQANKSTATKDPRIGQPVLSSGLIVNANKISISSQSQSFTMAKGANGIWEFPDSQPFVVDAGEIQQLLTGLHDNKIVRVITKTKDNFADFGLTDAVRVSVSDGQNEVTVVRGSAREQGQGQYIAFNNEEIGYVTDTSLYIQTNQTDWESKSILDWKTDEVTNLVFSTPAPAAFTATKIDGQWKSDDAQIDVEAIEQTVGTFAGLSYTERTPLPAPDQRGELKRMIQLGNANQTLVKFEFYEKTDGQEQTTNYVAVSVTSPNGELQRLQQIGASWLLVVPSYLLSSLEREPTSFIKPPAVGPAE